MKPEAQILPPSPVCIVAFYQFAPKDKPIAAEAVKAFAKTFEDLGRERSLKGLIIAADEGVNGTISGFDRDVLSAFLAEMATTLELPEFPVKWSQAAAFPFRKFKIRIREEIVTSGEPTIKPPSGADARHLSPTEWQRTLENEDVIVLDTRNWYETDIGKFRGALDPRIKEFQEFDGYLDRSDLPKEKKILIYCTGGIRCEKAIVEMEKKGFQNVYQLEGGILNYLAHFPQRAFEGECFVFDQRVAVDQELQPTSAYRMCPHCGQPAAQSISCLRCETGAIICTSCNKKDATQTCSKNCAHHYARSPGKKGRNQKQSLLTRPRESRKKRERQICP